MSVKVGVIAEDQSDVDVVEAILDKVAKRRYAIRQFLGYGCGKILGKCNAWARDLRARGCTCLIVIHDLDDRVLATFNGDFQAALGVSPISKHVLIIPVREIEAWLLADHEAVSKTVRAKKPVKKIANPEASFHAKEDLRDLIDRITNHHTVYVNTIHNRQIAKNARIENFKRCASFIPLYNFAVSHLG